MKKLTLSIIILLSVSFVFIPVNGDLQYCIGQSHHAQAWQKTICINEFTCETPQPNITIQNQTEFLSFDLSLDIRQTAGSCYAENNNLQFLTLPSSYDIKIIDSEFNYTVQSKAGTLLDDFNFKELHNDIQYTINITSFWEHNFNQYSRYQQFIEDDYGNLVEPEPLVHEQTLSFDLIYEGEK